MALTTTAAAPRRNNIAAVARFPSPDGLSIQPPGVSGVVLFRDVPEGCRVTVFIRGLEPNAAHALHVHEGRFGDETDLMGGCKSVGGHFNPDRVVHGSLFVRGSTRHAGDLLNNVFADAAGVVHVTYVDDLLAVGSPHHSPVGHSIVMHSSTDDLGLGGLLSNMQGDTRPPRTCADIDKLWFAPYTHMDDGTLRQLQRQRYPEKANFGPLEVVSLLLSESLKTGNAGGRLLCANIDSVEEEEGATAAAARSSRVG